MRNCWSSSLFGYPRTMSSAYMYITASFDFSRIAAITSAVAILNNMGLRGGPLVVLRWFGWFLLFCRSHHLWWFGCMPGYFLLWQLVGLDFRSYFGVSISVYSYLLGRRLLYSLWRLHRIFPFGISVSSMSFSKFCIACKVPLPLLKPNCSSGILGLTFSIILLVRILVSNLKMLLSNAIPLYELGSLVSPFPL